MSLTAVKIQTSQIKFASKMKEFLNCVNIVKQTSLLGKLANLFWNLVVLRGDGRSFVPPQQMSWAKVFIEMRMEKTVERLPLPLVWILQQLKTRCKTCR